jgi:hypothetical protein
MLFACGGWTPVFGRGLWFQVQKHMETWVSGGLIASGQKSALITRGSAEVLDGLCPIDAFGSPLRGWPGKAWQVCLCFAKVTQGV